MRRAPNGPRCLGRIACAHEAPLIACAFNQIEKLLMRVDLELGVDVFKEVAAPPYTKAQHK